MSDDGAALLKGGNAAGGETPQDDYPVNPVGEGQTDTSKPGVDDGDAGVGPIGTVPDEPASGSGDKPAGDTDPAKDTGPKDGGIPAKPSQEGHPVVFIYHTHARESFKPELKNGGDDPQSSKINVSLVGQRLASQLEKRGVGALHNSEDYPSQVPGFQWVQSYNILQKSRAAGDELQQKLEVSVRHPSGLAEAQADDGDHRGKSLCSSVFHHRQKQSQLEAEYGVCRPDP